jgi:tRNA threonylcarbamoyladenosine biosynthesis protein TsaE
MTPHPEHATFENREQTDRPGADDGNVGLRRIECHQNSLSMVFSMMAASGSSSPQAPEWAVLENGSSTDRLLQDRLLANEAETGELAGRLAAIVGAGDIIALRGDLGAGKTALARAFVRAYGRADEEVPSPTFTLLQVYEPSEASAPAVWHFDLFRVSSPEDALELGIEEAFASAITLIEWPERLGALLPARRLELGLAPGGDPESRRLRIRGSDTWRARLRQAGLV